MKTVLVATRVLAEAGQLRDLLGSAYRVSLVGSPSDYDPDRHACDAAVLDTNFTEHQGIDFLKKVVAHHPVPVLMLTPEDDPPCAIEAMHAGASNYLVKSAGYQQLLQFAIDDAIERSNEQDELKRTILALRQRVSELEGQLGSRQEAPAARPVPATAEEKKRHLLEDIVQRLRQGEINLPSFPEITVKLRKLISDQATIDEVRRLLEADAAIAAKLISVANSPFYKGTAESRTLEQAINRLGLTVTRHYVELISNRALYINNNKRFQPLFKQLWVHSMACAHASYLVARLTRTSAPDEIFTMGLLHDIGSLFLLQIVSEMDARGVLEQGMRGDNSIEFVKTHHGRFGKTLLQRWNLPEIYGHVALYHDNLDPTESPSRELLVVHFANLLVKGMGYRLGPAEEVDLAIARSAKMLNLDPDTIGKVTSQLAEIIKASPADLD